MGAVGFEHPSEMPDKQRIPADRGTESGTLGDGAASNRQPADPDLADVVKAWPDLPAAVKAGILAMIRAASE